MTYIVEWADEAEEQIATLPKQGLLAYLPAHIAIAVDPWAAPPYGSHPEGNMRVLTFGFASQGMVVYLVLDRQQKVYVIEVMWAG